MTLDDLKTTLLIIDDLDPSIQHVHPDHRDAAYRRRNDLVLKALHEARQVGLVAGISVDPAEPDWPLVFIELPTGQVSWHIPAHRVRWDGHDHVLKTQRINRFAREGQ